MNQPVAQHRILESIGSPDPIFPKFCVSQILCMTKHIPEASQIESSTACFHDLHLESRVEFLKKQELCLRMAGH